MATVAQPRVKTNRLDPRLREIADIIEGHMTAEGLSELRATLPPHVHNCLELRRTGFYSKGRFDLLQKHLFVPYIE